MVNQNSDLENKWARNIYVLVLGITLLIIFAGIAILVLYFEPDKLRAAFNETNPALLQQKPKSSTAWKAPDLASITSHSRGAEILFGRELIVHTSEYLWP